MNETYEKPVIRFESFELSTSICGSCGPGANSGASGFGYSYFDSPSTRAFGQEEYGVMLFLTGVDACIDKVSSEMDGSFYCYNNPSGDSAVYSS